MEALRRTIKEDSVPSAGIHPNESLDLTNPYIYFVELELFSLGRILFKD
jgi:hypothetical protein